MGHGTTGQTGKRAAYPAYKPSGVEWLGEVPEHWEVRRLKHLASVQFSSVDKHTIEGEQSVRLCNYVDVYYNDFINEGLNFMAASATRSEIERFQIRQGDVLITKDSESWDDIAVPAYVAEELDGVLCGYHLAHIRPDLRKLLSVYLFRAFQARGVNDQFRVAASGITRFGLGKYWLDNGQFLVPTLDEQRAIAAFLDRETGRIDALIAKKERQIQLLQEKRAALISHAVTKGLNPDAPMNDSGIPWLGQVPAHWAKMKISWVGRVFNGTTPSRNNLDYWHVGTVPWLSSGKVNDEFVVEPSEFITRGAVRDCSLSTVPRGSVIVKMIGQGKTRGMSAYLEIDACINQNLAAVVPTSQLDGRFLHMYLMASYSHIREYGRGANQEALNCEIVGALRILVPPIDEQRAVIELVDKKTGHCSSMIRKIDDSILLLREYRTALISAAVTGKIDAGIESKERLSRVEESVSQSMDAAMRVAMKPAFAIEDAVRRFAKMDIFRDMTTEQADELRRALQTPVTKNLSALSGMSIRFDPGISSMIRDATAQASSISRMSEEISAIHSTWTQGIVDKAMFMEIMSTNFARKLNVTAMNSAVSEVILSTTSLQRALNRQLTPRSPMLQMYGASSEIQDSFAALMSAYQTPEKLFSLPEYSMPLASRELLADAYTLKSFDMDGEAFIQSDNEESVPPSSDSPEGIFALLASLDQTLPSLLAGARIAADGDNPDKARQVLTSIKSLIDNVLWYTAPDDKILVWDVEGRYLDKGKPSKYPPA